MGKMRSQRRSWWLLCLAAVGLTLAVGVYRTAGLFPAASPGEEARTHRQNADPRQCAACHADIDRTYRKTGMGRSFYRPSPRNMPEDSVKSSLFDHRATNTRYEVVQRGGDYFQRRWQVGRAGNELNLREWKIDFIMGSGNHSRSYLEKGPGGRLSELPLAWYSEKGGYWGMNPGYDTDRVIMPRRIVYECMFCHNGYPEIPAGNDRWGSEPVYRDPLPEGIDCQRCHGPGADHVKAASVSRQRARETIVNPSRLNAELQMEVCMQCHLQTTSFRLPGAIRRFDRGPFSYRPGEPLGDFMIVFDRPADSKREDRFEIASSAYRLRQSKCFTRSKGSLTCTTCHNPHSAPSGPSATNHYANTCRKCHATALQGLVGPGRHPAGADCVACHMPKRRTDDVVHVVMTDHLIQRRKPSRDPLAEKEERHETDATAYHGEVVPYYPAQLPPKTDNDLYVAIAQVQHKSNLEKGVPRLTAALERQKPRLPGFYFELGEAWRNAGKAAKAAEAYQEAAQRDAGSAFVLRRLGDALWKSGQTPRAAEVLQRAVEAAPDNARGWYEQGIVLLDLGRKTEAANALERAATLDPDLPEAHNSLGVLLIEGGQGARAEDAFRSALRAKPDFPDAHTNLAMLLASKGALEEAADHFEAGLRYAPGNTEERCNYAVVLGRMDRLESAQRQLETVIKTDPNLARARELLGTVHASQGRLDEAIREFLVLLRLQPGSPRAHLSLGMLMIQKREPGRAAEHLRMASRGSDPEARNKALELLRGIGGPAQ